MKVSSYRGFEIWLQAGAYVSYIGDIRIGHRMTEKGAQDMIDRMLNTGGVYLPYNIINRDTGESKRLDVTEKEIIEEYGEMQKPSPTFIKDLAFERGLFDRRDFSTFERTNYKLLSAKRVYR